MSIITKNSKLADQVLIPKADIFHYGRGRVEFGWNITRKVPFWFLFYFFEPGACLNFCGRKVHPGGHEIVLIPPDTPFISSCEAPFDHLYIHFNAGYPYSQVKPEVLIFDRSICGILDLLLNPETSSDTAIYALLFSVLAAIPRKQYDFDKDCADDRIRHSMLLMNQGKKKGDICRGIGMSRSNFQRKFKAETGITPHQYALQVAMEKARAMLSFGTAGINEIAESCGFSDRYIFSKAFKKETGIPPAEYRSRHGSGVKAPGHGE